MYVFNNPGNTFEY